jgi:methylthioribose-1-phosphate isomerase
MVSGNDSLLQHDRIRAVEWDNGRIKLLDQRLLPSKLEYLYISTLDHCAQAIRDMAVRGAPAIGVAAAYGVVLGARDRYTEDPQEWKQSIGSDLERLAAARPTAVNLRWAIDKMRDAIRACPTGDPTAALLTRAESIHADDIAANRRMGELGAALIAAGSGVLTHCNTGSLATGGFGTALGVVRAGYAQQRIARVFADETRPWLQGTRLTAWELARDGIPATLIADGAAAWLMKQGQVQWVIVGADRIAENGDTANKIGTYMTAIVARRHGARFMVVAPTSTIDMGAATGEDIPIETRSENEILEFAGTRVAPEGMRAWNPAFDVTPAELIDAIVTEKGVVERPTREKMAVLMARQ